MSYIYKITNDINGKIYIGKTEYSDPRLRWIAHLSDYNRQKNEKRPLYSAMRKYGEEHFHFEIIEQTNDPVEREKYWINKLRTYVGFNDCNGYNATLGGDGKSYLNLDEDEVITYHVEEAAFILYKTAQYFKVCVDTIREILLKNDIPIMSSIVMNRLKIYFSHGGVLQINIDNKNIENIHDTIAEANRCLGIKNNNIKNACNSQNFDEHVAYGYIWCYGKDYSKYKNEIQNSNFNNQNSIFNKVTTKNRKSRNHYDFDAFYKDLIKTKSIQTTMKNLGIDTKSRYHIRKKLEELNYDLSILNEKTVKVVQKDKKTGEIIKVYNSMMEANMAMGKDKYHRGIYSCAIGKTKSAFGYIWEYI